MGINSSFLTQSCTQLNLQLTQNNLLSLDFIKISTHHQYSSEAQIQLYQHCHTNKLYKLQKFQCHRKHSHLLTKALKNLQFIKNNHICNVLFSQVSSPLVNIISKQSQAKIFSEHSQHNLVSFIQQKVKQIMEEDMNGGNQSIQNIMFTNLEIANFIHDISGLATEISTLCLPLTVLDPQNFIIMQNQHGKLKYSLNFDQILNQNNYTIKGYFSPQFFQENHQKQIIFSLNQNLWHENYQKHLIFSLGMIILHFLQMEQCNDCYNYKAKQFCQSQLENKLQKISILLENKLLEKQESIQIFKQSRASFSSSGRLSTKSNCFSQQEPFQVTLYEIVMEMLCQEPQKRITVKQLKFRSRKLMQKVHNQVMLKSKSQSSQINSNIFEKAKQQKAIITSSDFPLKDQSFQEFFLFIKKVSSTNETNNTDSILPESRSKSVIKHLKSKRFSNREKSVLLDSNQSFITNKENFRTQNNESMVKDTRNGFRKLSGYRKVKISEHSFLEGFFQNDKAHGLGKITKKNGEIIECIFHNNEIIDAIHPKS